MTDARHKGRRTLVLLALVFLGPLAVAMAIWYSGFAWRPAATTEHGILLQPPPRLPDHELAPAGRLDGRWSMIYVGAAECDEHCRQALVTMRQVRRALGKDMDRVQRVFCATGGTPDPEFLQREHPGLLVVNDAVTGHGMAATIGRYATGDIFLADPLRNLVLHYPAGTSMKDIHTDLQRLLKVSRIG
jgi:hypothetical protein